MINDIQKFLRSNENIDEYETNQYFIGIKYLFHSFAITNWFSTNFSSNNYTDYNRIIIKHYINYYVTYWYHRNEIA